LTSVFIHNTGTQDLIFTKDEQDLSNHLHSIVQQVVKFDPDATELKQFIPKLPLIPKY